MAIALGMVNTKGGVGKTTTAVNLAAMLADGTLGQAYQVLLIDMDPQGSASRCVGQVDTFEDANQSLTAAMIAERPGMVRLENIMCRSPWTDNLYFVPVHTASMKNAPSAFRDRKLPDTILRRLLAPLQSSFDFIIIDFLPTAPSTNIFFFNGLNSIDLAIIPTQLTQLALEGLPETLAEIQDGEISYERDIPVIGILPTEFRSVTSQKIFLDDLRSAYPDLVYSSPIPLSTDVPDAFIQRLPLHLYSPRASATKAYIEFGKETLRRAQERLQ